MCKVGNVIKRVRNGLLAAIIVVGMGFMPVQSHAGWWSGIPGVGKAGDIIEKVSKGDWKGAGREITDPVKKALTGIKTLVTNPGLLVKTTALAAQCAPKIVATAAAGAGASLLVQDFLANGPCTQFNRICSEQVGDLVCPNIDNIRNTIVSACQDPNVQQAIAGKEAAQYCAGTVANGNGGRFGQSDQAFGAQPNAQDMQMAQVASTVSADEILKMSAQQMTQLLQMHQEEFTKLVALNENQRRDFLVALDKEGARFERVIDKFKDYAAEGRALDHETIMTLLTGTQQEREAMYQRHKVEIDRMALEYNEKVNAANAERDAAVKQLTDMTQSLNRQLIMAQITHAACSQSIDNITWCGIRYRNNPEKCTALEDKKRILCE